MTTSSPLRPSFGLLAVAIAGAMYAHAFPARPDYVGHFLGGAGGALILVAIAVLSPRLPPWAVVVTAAVAVAFGVVTEMTIFKLAEFDPVDVANQSLGAVLACAAFIDARGPYASAVAGGCSLLFIATGFGSAFF